MDLRFDYLPDTALEECAERLRRTVNDIVQRERTQSLKLLWQVLKQSGGSIQMPPHFGLCEDTPDDFQILTTKDPMTDVVTMTATSKSELESKTTT